MAQTLGLRELPGQRIVETVGEYLRDKTMLLLDNLEQITQAAPEIVAVLRAAAANAMTRCGRACGSSPLSIRAGATGSPGHCP